MLWISGLIGCFAEDDDEEDEEESDESEDEEDESDSEEEAVSDNQGKRKKGQADKPAKKAKTDTGKMSVVFAHKLPKFDSIFGIWHEELKERC